MDEGRDAVAAGRETLEQAAAGFGARKLTDPDGDIDGIGRRQRVFGQDRNAVPLAAQSRIGHAGDIDVQLLQKRADHPAVAAATDQDHGLHSNTSPAA